MHFLKIQNFVVKSSIKINETIVMFSKLNEICIKQ